MVKKVKIYVGSIIIVSIILSLMLYYVYANFNQEKLEELVAKELGDLNNYLMTNLTIIRTPVPIQDIYLSKLLDRCIQLINSIDNKIGSYDGDREIIERFNKIKSIILNINTTKLTAEKEGVLVNSIWELGYISGYIQADTNNISYNDIENQITQIKKELSETYVKYISKQKLQIDPKGASQITIFLKDHIFAVQTIIESELYQANKLINQTIKVTYMEGRPYANRIGMEVSTIMAIQSLILKVNILIDHYDAFYTTETISHIYELKLSKLSLNKFKDIPDESFANLTLKEANNYLHKAEEEASQNLYAQAIIDLIIAEILYQSINDLIKIPDPFLKTTIVNIKELVNIKNSIITKLVEINKGNKIDKLILSKLLFYPIEDIKFIQTLMNRRIEINKIDNKTLTYLYAFLERALIYLENLNKKLVDTTI